MAIIFEEEKRQYFDGSRQKTGIQGWLIKHNIVKDEKTSTLTLIVIIIMIILISIFIYKAGTGPKTYSGEMPDPLILDSMNIKSQ